MLMALAGLFKNNMVEWLTSMTYQAASGAGAKNMRELLEQMDVLSSSCRSLLKDSSSAILDIDRIVTDKLASADFPAENFGVPLAASPGLRTGSSCARLDTGTEGSWPYGCWRQREPSPGQADPRAEDRRLDRGLQHIVGGHLLTKASQFLVPSS